MIAILLLALSLQPARPHAHVFVGNGGEGVEIGGRLFLRDLYETGTHLDPRFGREIDPALSLRVESGASLLPPDVDRSLLARKLSDLQRLSPLLGALAWASIEYYRWALVDEPLALPPEEGSPFRPGLGRERVALANRYQGIIRLHKSGWARLSSEHRVALLLHEALYSFHLPECRRPGDCRQPAERVRDLVSLAFSDPYGPAYRLSPATERSLVVPEVETRRSCGWYPPRVEVRIGSALASLPGPERAASRRAFFDKACSQPGRTSRDGRVTVTMHRDPFRLVELSYRRGAPGGHLDERYIGFIEATGTYRFARGEDWARLSAHDCSLLLRSTADLWFGYNPSLSERDPVYACEHGN